MNEELAQLENPTPTHPEFLRQRRIIENYRDEKMKREELLFAYKLKSLNVKSQAERSQANSMYYQNARDIRERYLQELSEHHYRAQHDRFRAGEITPDYGIPFPTRRPQQAAQQAAYNKEVGILAGTAKYVGFPSAPDMKPLQRREIEEDFSKLGVCPQSKLVIFCDFVSLLLTSEQYHRSPYTLLMRPHCHNLLYHNTHTRNTPCLHSQPLDKPQKKSSSSIRRGRTRSIPSMSNFGIQTP